MTTTTKILVAVAALGLYGAAATAAPLGTLTGAGAPLKSDATEAGVAEHVTYRCWRHRGHVHCGNVRPQYYSYYYTPRSYYFSARPYVSFGYRGWY